MEKQGVIAEGVTPPEDETEYEKQAAAGQSPDLEQHATTRFSEKAKGPQPKD